MKNWGLCAAIALVAVVSGVVSGLHLDRLDAAAPLGFRTQIRVDGATSNADPDKLAVIISKFADESGTAIARIRPSTEDAFSSRHLYIADGTSGSHISDWLTDGYPAFSQNANTYVHSWGELDFTRTDPRGFYLLAAPPTVGRELVKDIRDVGFTADAYPFLPPVQRAEALMDNGGGQSVMIAILVAIVLAMATVLLGAKTYGVARLHGHGFAWMFIRDLGRAAPGMAAAIALPMALAAGILGVYNGLNQFGTFMQVAGLLFAVSFSFVLASYAFALWLATRTDIVAAIKGRIPDRPTLALGYVLRISAAFLAVQALAMSVNQYDPAQAAKHDLKIGQQRAGGAAYLLLSGTVLDVGGEQGTSVASWLQHADEDGRIALAELSPTEPGQQDPQLLTVNPTYLREQTIISADGERISADSLPTDRATLLTPKSRDFDIDKATKATQEKIEFAAYRSNLQNTPESSQMKILSGQELFTYGSSTGQGEPTIADAAVLVVPPELGLWGPEWISMADSVVILEAKDEEGLEEAGLPNGALATQPVVEVLATTARDAHIRWLTAVMNAVVATGVLLIAVAAAVAVYTRGWAMRMFVRFAHGWRRWRANPVLVAAETAAAALLIIFGAMPWIEKLTATPPNPSTPPPPVMIESFPPETTLLASIVVAVSACAVAMWTLRARERRILRDRAIDRM